ncbi:MAG: UbiA family prenyltransferase [Planctomycetes bacterium]|nr:UbiA family prenyltransferase [Planctomycetota bacterium]
MNKTRAYLQLLRFPAVFTAMADIFLGFLLADPHTSLEENALPFAKLLVASCCLYMAGMVFNDVFDRKIDAEERPERPIPAGRVSVMSAVRLGILLIVCGLGAADARGVPSLLVAIMIVVGILSYDGFLKKTAAGPLVMGGCRFLNVLLGASAVESFADVWTAPQIYVAGGLGIYITGVTWFGRTEARRSNRFQLAGAMTVINLGLAAIVLFVAVWENERTSLKVLLILAVIALTINRRLTNALRNPQPQPVQDAIKMMLYSLVMLDATLVLFYTGNMTYAALTAGLVIPAMFLGRWIFVT